MPSLPPISHLVVVYIMVLFVVVYSEKDKVTVRDLKARMD